MADALVGPVTNILTRVEVTLLEAEARPLPPETVEDLRTILHNARRLVHVVEALRHEAGQGPAGWRPVRLNETVTRAARPNGLAGSAMALDPGDPMVLADADSLEHLLRDVLTDAASPVSPDRIEIVTARQAGRPGWVEVTIRGLPETAALPASARSVLEAHDTSAEVRSGFGGAEFRLRLPLFALPQLGASP